MATRNVTIKLLFAAMLFGKVFMAYRIDKGKLRFVFRSSK